MCFISNRRAAVSDILDYTDGKIKDLQQLNFYADPLKHFDDKNVAHSLLS